MKNAKLFLALGIIMAIAIAPASGAFAQSDDVSNAKHSDKQIDKEKQIQDHNDQRKDRLDDREIVHDIEASLMFNGITSGWAIVNGKALPAEFILDGKAGHIEKQGLDISGTGTVFLDDREIVFDLNGFAKNNHINIKGVSQDDDSVTIHLRGNFTPITENEDSFALAFTKAAIFDESSDVKVSLILVGDVTVEPITPIDEPNVEETDFEADLAELDELLELLS